MQVRAWWATLQHGCSSAVYKVRVRAVDEREARMLAGFYLFPGERVVGLTRILPAKKLGRLHIRVLKGVPKKVGVLVRKAWCKLTAVVPIKIGHSIYVYVVPGVVIKAPDGTMGFAVFEWRRGMKKFRIGLGGWAARRHAGLGPEMFLESFVHELVHYEQVRDRKPVIERGVVVRAKAIYRQCELGKLASEYK